MCGGLIMVVEEREDMVNVIIDCAAVPSPVKHLQALPPLGREGEGGPRSFEHELEKGSAFTLGSEDLNPSFLGRRSALATGGIAAIITLSLILVFNARKQAPPTEGSRPPSPEVLRCFSFSEIVSATESSNRLSFIRRQGFGHISKGFIDDGKQMVFMIRLSFNLWNEVKALSKLRHDNLVSLIGYCNESPHMILVYESMPLTLRTSLMSDNLQTNTPLSWHHRLKICTGAARGLDYLHTCTDGGITHGDFKSSHILLDEKYKPKITDFGLTKLEEHSHSAQKSDVYSFGIVLLEVLCGKASEYSSDRLISWAKSLMISDGRIDQMVDPRLNGQISSKCLREFVAIIRKCLRDDPKRRPTMVRVVAWLELLSDNNVNVCGESSATEPSHKKKESSMSRDLRQCVSWSEFDPATLDFNRNYVRYDAVAYKIYIGKYIFGSRTPPYIIYRGKYMPNDISKLTELSNLSHPNLASWEGYCCKDKETIVGYKNEGLTLLYEYQYSYYLSWPKRLKICIGAAEAVECMHAAKIIHGGICSTTLFVDGSYCAKLATFGTVSRNGSAYYGLPLPPDIAGSAKMTEKTDVYLFGLLLLTIFCGKKMDFSGGFPFVLHNKFQEAINQKTLCYITDMNLKEIEYNLAEFLDVAFGCCRFEQSDRPSMDSVVRDLNKAQALQKRNHKHAGDVFLF